MICIIPARGGSTRFPGKNIKKLFGRPVIEWVIEAAAESGVFDEGIVVTSDDLDLLDSFSHFDDVIKLVRSLKTSGDVPEVDVLREVIEYFGTEHFCRIYPFAALLTPERIRIGHDVYIDKKWSKYMCIEVQEYTHPPDRAINEEGYVDGETVNEPTQNLDVYFHDAATYMFSNLDSLSVPLHKRHMDCNVVKEWEAQDVDYPDDWEMLKLKMGRKLWDG